jgi:KUP system potassium uptake protein
VKRADSTYITLLIYGTEPIYWPTFVIAVLASIIASQAIISGTFSIIQQSLSLGCFPRVKVIHTSTKYEGQVYIPEANYLLMVACVGSLWVSGPQLGLAMHMVIHNSYTMKNLFAYLLKGQKHICTYSSLWKKLIQMHRY